MIKKCSLPVLMLLTFNIALYAVMDSVHQPVTRINSVIITPAYETPEDVAWTEAPLIKLGVSFISALASDRDMIWIGTWSEGLIVCDTSENRCWTANIGNGENPIIYLFAKDRDCWFTLADGRIGNIHFNENRCDLYEISQRDRHSWFESIEWFDGKFWFASSEEIITYDPDDKVWARIQIDSFPQIQFDQWRHNILKLLIYNDPWQALNSEDSQPKNKDLPAMKDRWSAIQSQIAEGKSVREILCEQIRLYRIEAISYRKELKLRTSGKKLFFVCDNEVIAIYSDASFESVFRREKIEDEYAMFSDITELDSKTAISTSNIGFVVYNKRGGDSRHIKRARAASLWETFNRGWGPWSEEDCIVSMEHQENIIWLATMKGRILKYDAGSDTLEVFIRLYPYIYGQATSFIYHAGAFWVGTTQGLLRFDPARGNNQTFADIGQIVFDRGRWIKYIPRDDTLELGTINEKNVYAAICQYMGTTYYWGRSTTSGADCSGLVLASYKPIGVYLPHSSKRQHDNETGTYKIDELRFGDLLFFHNPISHVGIYLGEGRFVHAFGGTRGVTVSSLADSYLDLTGVKRVSLDVTEEEKKDKLLVLSKVLVVRESPNKKSATVTRLNEGDVVKLIARQKKWSNIQINDKLNGWVSNNYVRNAALVSKPKTESQIARIISSSSQPLLKARSDKVLTSDFPIKNVKTANGWNSITLNFDVQSDVVQNNHIMLVVLSKNAYQDSLRQTIQTSGDKRDISRIDVLRNRADLASMGFHGNLFDTYRSGIVAVLKAVPADIKSKKKSHLLTARFECQQSETESYFIVKLRGSDAGTLYRIF